MAAASSCAILLVPLPAGPNETRIPALVLPPGRFCGATREKTQNGS